MRNIKLSLRFAGTRYHGWQIQPNGITVQEIIGDAISFVTGGEKCTVTGCGRTDAGVHASEYAASFKTSSAIPCEKLPAALNSKLPDDIVCTAAEDVSMEFDAARSAKKKRYTYRILNSHIPDPFLFPYTHQIKSPLDLKKMKEAAAYFTGTHDFLGFAASGFTVKTTVRTIYSLDIQKNKDIISIDVTGDGFLYNMVRIIAGTLVGVGCGKINPDEIPDIINSRCRERAGVTLPAKGLCLSEVLY